MGSCSRQQELDIFPRKVLDRAAIVGAQNSIGQVAFLLLQFQDFLLNSSPADQAVGKDVLRLADAVRAVNGLSLDGGIPPGIKQVNIFSGGQIKSQPSSLQADQEYRAGGICLEPLDLGGTVTGAAIQILVDNLFLSRRSRTIARKLVNWEKTKTL